MKTFTDEYPINASTQQALALMTTQDYIEQKYRSLGANNLRVSVLEDSDEKFHSRVERVVRMRDKAPAFARKLVKEEMTVVHEVWWHKQGAVKQGGFKGQLPGISGGINAQLSMSDDADGNAVIRIDGEVSVAIPLIGGKLEGFMADIAAKKFREDIDATKAYIAQQL